MKKSGEFAGVAPWDERTDPAKNVLSLTSPGDAPGLGKQCLRVTATLGKDTGGGLYQVRKANHHPVAIDDCVIFAAGVVAADAKSIDFRMEHGAGTMGTGALASLPIDNADPEDRFAEVSDRVIDIEVRGKTPPALPGMFRGHSPANLRVVVFAEDQEESFGYPEFTSSSTSKGFDDVTEYERKVSWHAPKGSLVPGNRIRIGWTTPRVDDLHVFLLDVMPQNER